MNALGSGRWASSTHPVIQSSRRRRSAILRKLDAEQQTGGPTLIPPFLLDFTVTRRYPLGMEPLTQRQQQVLDLILDFQEREDRPPTSRELARRLGKHVKTVYQYLLVLERKGYIARHKRHIRVAPELRASRGIPIVGNVAAGTPILAVENREGVLSLDDAFGRDGLFAVRVEGDSMRDAGILDGDVAIVRADADVAQNAIALCYVGEDTTVKRLRRTKAGFDLIPENDAYDPLHIPKGANDFRVGGPVVGIVRNLH